MNRFDTTDYKWHITPCLAPCYEDCKKFNARTAIGKTKMEDIKKWRADNLLPNPSIKRMNVLKKVS